MISLRKIVHQCGIWAQEDRQSFPYWAPVWLGLGIGFYFWLPTEPSVWASAIPLLILGFGWFLAAHRPIARFWLVVGLLMVLGVFAGSVRTAVLQTVQLDKPVPIALVKGTLESKEASDKGTRFVLKVQAIEQKREAASLPLPSTIRLTLVKHPPSDLPAAGSEVQVLARLLPISGPFYAGSYDFRRQAYFDGLGATGIAFKVPEVIGQGAGIPLAESGREAMGARIAAVLSGPAGAIATALMTGERGAIDAHSNDILRAAGIAHIISISGMHIGMLGGMVFFLVRVLLALVPFIALRFSVRKIAALVALVAIVFYTWLVGAPIPAVRAMLMAGLVFIAIMVDRRALTLRTVALSAFCILLIYPESLLTPGFQMSFGAILALVSGFEAWTAHKRAQPFAELDAARPSLFKLPFVYVGGVVLSSILAGAATMPFGAWHFQRLQLLGVLGNLAAVPLTGVIVMPAGLAAWVLTPFGLEGWPLRLMGWGLDLMLQSAAWVAALPGANVSVPAFPMPLMLLMVGGGLWLCIWTRPWRLYGLIPIVLAIVLVPFFALRPVAVVGAEGQMAVRVASGEMVLLKGSAKGMLADVWARSFAGGAPFASKSEPHDGLACDALGCVLTTPDAVKIALPRLPLALADDCQHASLVVAPLMRVPSCQGPRQVIDKKSLFQSGSLMIFSDGTTKAARPTGSWRPWFVRR